MVETRTDGRILRGEQTRKAILRRAVDIASAEGLEGLSIGRLATDLEISKSGVFTHFGSKEELQLATVRAAVEIFVDRVVKPARANPAGVRRVWGTFEAWLDYERQPVFAGGCFFYAVGAEFDARPGRVRDAVAHALADWLNLYERTIAEAIRMGEIVEGTDARQLAFELDAFATRAGNMAHLHDDPSAYALGRAAALSRLRGVVTDPSLLPAD
jgi:AcrR family transcriptional regulator